MVEERRVEPVPDELAKHREAEAHRRVRPKESCIQDREGRKEDDSCRAERVKGHDEPTVLEPSLHASEQGGVDSWEDQEDGKRREEREELRTLAEGPDEERFDRARDAADDEVYRDLREEYAEAERSHEKRDEEACAARDHSSGEPVPGKSANECPEILPSLGHARATSGRSLEPMPHGCSRPILYLAQGASAGRERMASSLSTQARVGRRIVLTVLWTMLLIVGVTIGLLVLVPGIQDSIQRASGAVAGGAFALSIAVALIILGLWGISANNRNLKHAVDLIAQVDRARKETIQLESTRYMQK